MDHNFYRCSIQYYIMFNIMYYVFGNFEFTFHIVILKFFSVDFGGFG